MRNAKDVFDDILNFTFFIQKNEILMYFTQNRSTGSFTKTTGKM